jgi:hypothetical protein
VKGDAEQVDGRTHGYFSYRHEAMAADPGLPGYVGFSHWLGGNAAEPNAANQELTFARVNVGPTTGGGVNQPQAARRGAATWAAAAGRSAMGAARWAAGAVRRTAGAAARRFGRETAGTR